MPGPAALLRAAAREAGPLPWLIHPGGVDWRWRSWHQIEDQVARGARALRLFGAPETVDVPARLSPDGIAAAWASLVAGRRVRPVVDGPAALQGEGDPGGDGPAKTVRWSFASWGGADGPRLPGVRSRLENWVAETVDPGGDPPGSLVHRRPSVGSAVRLDWGELLRRADRLVEALKERSGGGRPIYLLGGRLDGLAEQVALIASVRSGAAVAVEPDGLAFPGSVASLRPRVVVAPPSLLEALPEVLSKRRVRRWSRLEAVVVPSSGRDQGLGFVRGDERLLEGPWTLEEVEDRPSSPTSPRPRRPPPGGP